MVIYLDVLIVVNVYVTYFVLRASARLFRLKTSLRRIIAASVFGGLTSVTAALGYSFFGALLLKAGLTLMLTLIAFGFGSMGEFLLRSFTVLSVGMLVCGAAVLIREWTGSSLFTSAGGYVYINVSVLVLVGASTAAYFLITLFRRIIDRPSSDARLKLFVKNNGRSVELSAFPDSGNTLRDFLTGLPVIVCRTGSVLAVAPEGIETADTVPLSGVRVIPYSTVGGGGFIPAFRAESITVSGENLRKKNIEALIGVGEISGGDYDAVINPKLLI